MDPLNEYRTRLLNDASVSAVSEELYQSEAFLKLVLQLLVESGELEDAQLAYFRGKGSRNRNLAVDAYDLSGDDDTVSLMVLDYSQSDKAVTRPWGQVTKSLNELAAFAAEAVAGGTVMEIEPSSPAYGLANSIHRREVAISRFILYYITDGVITHRTKDFALENIGHSHVEWRAYDVQRLHAGAIAGSEREPIEIDLVARLGEGIPVLPVQATDSLGTYLAALPGQLLADLYHEHGTRLLESNVRAFLSGRGKVNKGIRTTLINEPLRFLPYNNGITATATEVVVGRSDDGGATLDSVTDLQIVNGGQTTASLFYSARDYKADLSDVWVQMKLVCVTPQDAQDLVPDIARFANSQNKVNEADFFSNHPYHQRLEQLGNTQVMAPTAAGSIVATHWFYERTRGAWQNLQNKSKRATAIKAFEAKYPRSQIITKTDAARYLVAWEGKPHVVSQGAQKNFMAFADQATQLWERSPDSINQEYYKELVAKAILYRDVRTAVLKADWYDKGYLANITAYTVAAIRYFFKLNFRRDLDLNAIWREQRVPAALLEEFARLAFSVFTVLTSEKRPVVNVTEWAKRELCWKQVTSMRFEFLPASAVYAADRGTRMSRMKDAAETQQTDSVLLDEVSILTKSPIFWTRLENFGRANRLLDSKASNILGQLKQGRIPSTAQIQVVSRLLKKAGDMGFHQPEEE